LTGMFTRPKLMEPLQMARTLHVLPETAVEITQGGRVR
jgi:hypothetical protein